MVTNNIAVVFGPTIMRPLIQSAQSDINDSHCKIAIAEYLITNAEKLFQ